MPTLDETEQLLGEPHDKEKLPARLWVWLAYIEIACELQLDTSEVHPSLARVTDKVQHLRVALQVLCEDHGHDMADVLEATKKRDR